MQKDRLLQLLSLFIIVLISIHSISAKRMPGISIYKDFKTVSFIDTVKNSTTSKVSYNKMEILETTGRGKSLSLIEDPMIDLLIEQKSKFFPQNWTFLKKNIYRISDNLFLVDYLKGDGEDSSEGYILILNKKYEELFMSPTKTFSPELSVQSFVSCIAEDDKNIYLQIDYSSGVSLISKVVKISKE